MAGKKKGKKKEKKTGEAADKLAVVDRTFYELTITDLNNKLARLRSHNSKLEEVNDELNEKLRKLEEDRTDITAYLDRNLAEKRDVIREMSEQLVELSKVREQEAKEAAEKIRDWEQRHKATHEQLSSEIKLLNGKLNSLEEFRIQKDELLARFDQQEKKLREQQNTHKDVIYEMERKVIIDKAQLKKEVQRRLYKLSDEFHRSGEIRMAAYTQRLMRENIALNNEMDKMIASQYAMEENHRNIQRRSELMKYEYVNQESIRERLVKTCQTQLKTIQIMTAEFDALKAKYGKARQYKKLYEETLKRDACERFKISDMEKRLTILKQRLDTLKHEKATLLQLHEANEAEVIRLQNIIKHIKFTVQSGILSESDENQCEAYRKAQRQGLLSEIIQIITTLSDASKVPSLATVSSVSSRYRTGSAGLLPRSASLLQLFKREARKIVTSELVTPELSYKSSEGKIIPSPRKLETATLFDVESGTTYIVSSVHPEDEEEAHEDELENEEIVYTSSSGQSQATQP